MLPFTLEAFLFWASLLTLETPVCYVAVLSLCSRTSLLSCARPAPLSFIHNFRVPLACHANPDIEAYVLSNADDEGEVFDLPQTPN